MAKRKTAVFHRQFNGVIYRTTLCYRRRWVWWTEDGASCMFSSDEVGPELEAAIKDRARKLGFTHFIKAGDWEFGSSKEPRSGKL